LTIKSLLYHPSLEIKINLTINIRKKMKNKLLATSALFGSLVIGSSAYAQTTVTGNLALSFKDNNDYKIAGSSTGTQSGRAFGRESQINVQNKGKLNNGMDYAAGFSLEFDGGRTDDSVSDENVYIDIISGNTTLTFGVDHIQNTNRTKGILIGEDAADLTSGNAIDTSNFIQSAGANSAQAMGLGVVQKTPVGSFSAWYAPSNTNKGSDDNVGLRAGVATTSLEPDRESTYELGFEGGFGVKGLNAHLFYNEEAKGAAAHRDLTGLNVGASYNMGQITVGYTRKETEAAGTNQATAIDTKQDEFGIAYAVSPNLTLAVNYTQVDSSKAAAVDAEAKGVAIGYNLGPVSIVGQYNRFENVNNVANSGEFDQFFIKAKTSF
jgi:predicted porin